MTDKTIKQRIIDMLNRLPDDIDYARAIEGIHVLQRYEIGLDEIRRGEVFDDDEVMAELLGDGQEAAADLDTARKG
jgi:predicted transcriptional regulator